MGKRKMFVAGAVALTMAVAGGALVACDEKKPEAVELDLTKIDYVVKGYEWGPAVPKAVIEFDKEVSGVTKDSFTVRQGMDTRTVTDAYTCDKDGNKVTTASKYVAVEMEVKSSKASPFVYDQNLQRNDWAETVAFTVTAKNNINVGEGVCVADTKFTFSATAANRKVPQTATWHKDTVEYKEGGKDITLSRASWTPAGAATDGGKNPLVIWLHGGGEGGTDIDIALLGNEVTALTTDNETNIQHYFTTDTQKGAYVLAVQTPTMWMDAEGNGEYGGSEAGSAPTGEPQTSYYTEALWKAITTYVDGNPDVDKNRIYVGGCSNGGYMTMNLAFEHGDYFAAYYPICQGYKSGNIDGDMLDRIKDLKMWFLLSADDTTLAPDIYTLPLYARLMEAGAENMHLTLLDHVRGVDDPNPTSWGAPSGCYMGHWSWIHAFNDDVKKQFDNSKITGVDYLKPENCTKDGNMWQWLAAQAKETAPVQPVVTDTFEAENEVIACGTTLQTDMSKVDWSQASNPDYWTEFNANPDNFVSVPVNVTVESGTKYTGTEETGDAVTSLGYFSCEGTSVTWTITAEEACDVTVTLHAASTVQDQSGITNQMTGEGLKLKEVDLSLNEYVKLTVNNEDKALTGTLPGLEGLTWQSDPSIYKNFGTGTATVHLNKGENTIVLAAMNSQGGLNIDKIVISGTTVQLSYIPTDNSARIPAPTPAPGA